MKEQIITAKTLLLMFLELQDLLDLNQWQEESISNPPRLLRLQQLKAMFLAFEIPFDPQLFVRGKFIDGDSPRYAAILKQLMPEEPSSKFFVDHKGYDRDQLPEFFSTLYRYRSNLNDLLSFGDGVYVASGLFLLALRKIAKLNAILRNEVANVIDEILVTLISPEMKTFTLEEMVQNYGYQDIDLLEIDMEWF